VFLPGHGFFFQSLHVLTEQVLNFGKSQFLPSWIMLLGLFVSGKLKVIDFLRCYPLSFYLCISQ
jgi:hypothetical protein